jgi:hypothetical protein
MLTLDELCADMAASGRYLTPRAARDWWTKGFLPRPQRRWLGRGKGSETFWTEPDFITRRAQATYDLLRVRSRANTTILGLWFEGLLLPTELGSVRAVYERRISQYDTTEEAVSGAAEKLARKNAKSSAVQEDIIDAVLPFLQVFYGLDDEVGSDGFAALWARAAPYLGGGYAWRRWPLGDDDLAVVAQSLNKMASVPAQRDALASATDHELVRTRRLVLVVFGYVSRFTRAAKRGEVFEEYSRRLALPLLMMLSELVPILITVLRKDRLRHGIFSSLPGLRAAIFDGLQHQA